MKTIPASRYYVPTVSYIIFRATCHQFLPDPFPGCCDVASRSRCLYGKRVKYPIRRQPPAVCHQHHGFSAKSRITGDRAREIYKAVLPLNLHRHSAMPPHDRTSSAIHSLLVRVILYKYAPINATTFLIYGCHYLALREATFR